MFSVGIICEMPSMGCVPGCHNRGGHRFPVTNKELCRTWIAAIRRADEGGKHWKPSGHSIVCRNHFNERDDVERTIHGRSRLL